jgi:hypothetical protein
VVFLGEHMETLKKFNIHLKSLSPLIMHNDQGADPFHPLVKKLKQITERGKKTDDHHSAASKIEFLLGIYYEESVGIYLPARAIMGSIKAAAKDDKKTKFCSGITIDSVFGPSLIGYEKTTPEDLWNIEGKKGKVHVHISPVNVGRSKIMRTRPIFPKWEVKFDVFLNTLSFNPEVFAQLIEKAGFEKGVLELRPQKVTGNYGRFTLESIKEIK